MTTTRLTDEEWENLSLLLRTRVARWVQTSYNRPLWIYQRNEIIEDIVEETIVRIVLYMQKIERGEKRAIDSFEKIGYITAYHCYVDALRRDRYIVPLIQNNQEPCRYIVHEAEIDPSEQAIDNIHYELLFIQAARWIVNFPEKQKTALLVDLANRMHFDPFRPTPLQKALASAGIDIRAYNRPLPFDAKARSLHAAHLSLALKRLAEIAQMQHFTYSA